MIDLKAAMAYAFGLAALSAAAVLFYCNPGRDGSPRPARCVKCPDCNPPRGTGPLGSLGSLPK